MAGELGLGCLAQTSVGLERAEKLIGIYKKAIKQAKPVGKFVHNQVAGNTVAFCAEDRRKAFQRGADLIDWYRAQQRIRDSYVWQGFDPAQVPEDYKWHYQRSISDPVRRDETPSLQLIQQGGRFCIGDPDDCIRYIEQYEAMGVDEIMPLFQVGPVTHREVMNALRLFGKYVIPHFREKARKARASEAVSADN
jgi:alkanesulfonate monooxygenase SsuD/methylene tetrahydromethanopterin reductase-like flavin-dependent oxidoreductase (luciferase family)